MRYEGVSKPLTGFGSLNSSQTILRILAECTVSLLVKGFWFWADAGFGNFPSTSKMPSGCWLPNSSQLQSSTSQTLSRKTVILIYLKSQESVSGFGKEVVSYTAIRGS